MAVTKTHPIKSTLKAAIDYICNPDKTDGKMLVSSFGCAAETADIEFEWTRRHSIDKGTHLGRHLIQAFEPGEVMPEEAHRIGMELAREVLGGKYEFVLTTHIDKDHVHNHLIFNAVSFTDHKHYHSNKRSYHEIRRASDRLCREHGLSVIVPGRDMAMPLFGWFPAFILKNFLPLIIGSFRFVQVDRPERNGAGSGSPRPGAGGQRDGLREI